MKNQRNSMKHLVMAAIAALGALAQASCNSIDDDLSDCGIDAAVSYDMLLLTNMETELTTVLSAPADAPVAAALRQHLAPIFSDRAHDLNIAFYQLAGAGSPSPTATSAPLHLSEQHIIDATHAEYSFYLPMAQYHNQALANLERNTAVALTDNGDAATATLVTRTADTRAAADTLLPHTTGLFTARLPMDLSRNDVPRNYHATLYMANSAAAIVIDTTRYQPRHIAVSATGFATAFTPADSTYHHAATPADDPMVATTTISPTEGTQTAYCTVAFPSRDSMDSWQLHCYVTKTDGTVVRTVLTLHQPLPAAQLKVIKAFVDDQGVVRTHDQQVGVSVTLDWNQGGEYTPDL